MTQDPRYPNALTPEEPEFPSIEAERDYWKGLALSYADKLGALGIVFKRYWTAYTDPVTGEVMVREEVLKEDDER